MKAIKLACGLLLSALSSALFAQAYPARPITVVVGFPPGAGNDTAMRLMAPSLGDLLGQRIVVDNKPGAGSSIGTAFVAKSKPDGYTLFCMTAADTLLVAIQPNLPYNLERDFDAVASLITAGVPLVVTPSLPAKNLKELIALAKSQPGKLRYGSPGIGSSGHAQGELLNAMAQIDVEHVPYKGSPEAAAAVAAGQIDMTFAGLALAKSLSDAGKVRAIGISSAARASAMPDLPTLSEAGLPGFDYSLFYGLIAPRGVGGEVISKLNAAVAASLNNASVRDGLIKAGLTPQPMSPGEFGAYIKKQIDQNGRLAKSIGLKAE